MTDAFMGDKLHVSRQDLWKGFERHRAAAKIPAPSESHMLLMVYAIECGLKAVLLKTRNQFTTDKLADDDLTHELDDLLRCLNQPRRCVGQLMSSRPPRLQVSSGKLHELFRYGGSLDKSDMTLLAQRFEAIFSWLEDER